MNLRDESPAKVGALAQGGKTNKRQRNNTKTFRVLKALAHGWRGTRFDAERSLHDHCLHTTVSTIQQTFGIEVARERITVPGFAGAPTVCCRYWLTSDQRAKAQQLISVLGRLHGG